MKNTSAVQTIMKPVSPEFIIIPYPPVIISINPAKTVSRAVPGSTDISLTLHIRSILQPRSISAIKKELTLSGMRPRHELLCSYNLY